MIDEQERTPPHTRRSTWIVVAIVCLVAAGAALLAGKAEASFVLAALGVLAWFLNVRRNLTRDEDIDDDRIEEQDAGVHPANGIENPRS